MNRETYLCPNCRAPATFGKKFCCSCGVQFNWIVPLIGKQLTSVSCNTQPCFTQGSTITRLPRQEKLQRGHGCSGWDRPQSHNDEPSAGKPNQCHQYVEAGSKSVVPKKDLPVGSSTAPVRTAIIKLLEHFLEKQTSCN